MTEVNEQSGPRRGLLPRFTLKDGDTFLLSDALGDLHDLKDGLFFNDTRMLSRLDLTIADGPASLLGAAVSQDNTTFVAHLTNKPLPALGEGALPQGVIHVERRRLLWRGSLYERLRVTNFGDHRAQIPFRFNFAADYADIFEVQGHARKARGTRLPTLIRDRSVRMSYKGLDHVVRATEISFSHPPVTLSAEEAEFRIDVDRGVVTDFYLEVSCGSESSPAKERFDGVAELSRQTALHHLEAGAAVQTSGRLFNQWIARSRADLTLLTTTLPTGPYPYAGIPWFSTQFGRDAIIAALQTMWLNPQIAAGVLRFLASTQATETSRFRDSEPGKIRHETRRGEMAALGEVPFGAYYGGVDTTPLFIVLAGAYEERTGDRRLIDEIWPNLLAAVNWVEYRLKHSPSGFLDYARAEGTGLVNQAWKDSTDSIFHHDGRIPPGPIAVVEVQGYVHAAFSCLSSMARRRGEAHNAKVWKARAEELQAAIEEKFWLPELNYYAIALDGDLKPCRIRGSNAGHLLFCGVATPEHAKSVSEELLSPGFSSGWGIRTLAQGQSRYNPMSYHNGSVWPHDTAICAAGIARYGERHEVVKLLAEMFEAATQFSMRLPELYCGFARDGVQAPIPYPVACLPQAWASGSVFMFLQAILGVRIDGVAREIHIDRPALPLGIDALRLRALPVGESCIDIEFQGLGTEVAVIPSGHIEAGVKVIAHL